MTKISNFISPDSTGLYEVIHDSTLSGKGTLESPLTVASYDITTAGIFDAKGDLLVATGNDAATRLAVGTNGYILSANSATATGLEWITAPSGNSLYTGSGTIPTSVVATLTDTLTFTGNVANTNTVADRLIIQTNSTGTPATGFGGGILFQGESNTTTNRDMARIGSRWTVATDGSRETSFAVQLVDNAGSLQDTLVVDNFGAPRIVLGNSSQLTITNSQITFPLNSTIASTDGITISSSQGANMILSNAGTVQLLGGGNFLGCLTLGTNPTHQGGSAGILLGGNSNVLTNTSGTRSYIVTNTGITPTSGTAQFNMRSYEGTYNQTGGANGIIRILNFNPTLTSIVDLRAIEIQINNSAAKGIYQSGADTTNNFVGATNFGSTSTPNSTAIVEMTSTTKGFLPPRMTTTDRDNISTPAAGLTIYNTTTNKLNFYNGSSWEAVTST